MTDEVVRREQFRAKRTRRTAGIVLLLAFFDIFALLPVVGPHVTELGGGQAAIGLAVGAYSSTNLPANVIGGILVDRRGRRWVLLIGLAAASITVAAYTLATTVLAFIVTRMLHGVAGGVLIPAVFATAGDRAKAGSTGRSFGRLGALIGIAAVIAPASAGVIRQLVHTNAVFVSVAAALAAAWLITFWGVYDRPISSSGRPKPATGSDRVTSHPVAGSVGRHNQRSVEPRDDGEAADRSSAQRAMLELLTIPTLRRVLFATIILTAMVGVLAGFLPGTAEELGAEPSAVGALFTVYAAVAAGLMLSPLSGRVDQGRASVSAGTGLILLAAAMGLLAVAGTLWVAVIACAVFGAGFGLVFPAVAGATSMSASVHTRGRAFGLFNMAFSVGLALGPPLVGWVSQASRDINVFTGAAAVALIGAVLVLTSGGARTRGPAVPPTSDGD